MNNFCKVIGLLVTVCFIQGTIIANRVFANATYVFQQENGDPTKNATATACLNNRSGIGLVESKDMEGNKILAFPLDKLKNNVRYGFIENYKQGFSRIKKDQVWGFLNLCGDEVIPCQYEDAQPFNEGKALVKKTDWLFIDPNGNESDVPLLDIAQANALSKGLTLVKFKTGQKALIDNNYDKTNKPVSKPYDDIVVLNSTTLGVKINTKWGIFKLGEGAQGETNFDLIEPSGRDNLFKIYLNKKVGLVNANGEILWKPEFDRMSDVNNYGIIKGIGQDKQQLIDINDFRVSKVYQKISDFDEKGMAIVQDVTGLYGIINKNFKTVIEPVYVTLGALGVFDLIPASKTIANKGLKYGYLNASGQEVIPFEYEMVGRINKKGLMVVKESVSCNLDSKGTKLGTCKADKVIDVNGSTVVPPITKYPDAGKVSYEVTDSTFNHFLIVKAIHNDTKKNPSKYILIRGEDFKVITPEPYDGIQAVKTNMFFFVKLNEQWGTLDSTGRLLSKCQFKSVLSASEDYYLVQHENGKYGYLDAKGKIQVQPEYTILDSFKNGLAIATKGNNQVGIINKFNAKVVPCMFKNITLSGGKYTLLDDDGNRFEVDNKGECTLNCSLFESVRSKANNK